MLTQAGDFHYYSPIAAGIHGAPMPVRTGAAKSAVKYEDLVYLAEMATERSVWCVGDANDVGQHPSLVDPSTLVLKRDDLLAIQQCARDVGNGYNGYNFAAHAGTLVPVNWNGGLSNPIVDGYTVTDPSYEQHAYDTWTASAAFPDSTQGDASCMESVEPYAALFGYFDSMKRYVFDTYEIIRDDRLATLGGSYPIRLTQVGNASDGSQIYGPTMPKFSREHYESGGSWVTDARLLAANGGYNVYIHSPFSLNRLTGGRYYGNPNLYFLFYGRADWWSSAAAGYYWANMVVILKPRLATFTVGSCSVTGWEGVVPLSKPVVELALTDAWTVADDWAGSHITEWGEANRYWRLEVGLQGVYLDTGAIAHCSNLQA